MSGCDLLHGGTAQSLEEEKLRRWQSGSSCLLCDGFAVSVERLSRSTQRVSGDRKTDLWENGYFASKKGTV
jgi:hypothetical protein